jgi:hypothetical protein
VSKKSASKGENTSMKNSPVQKQRVIMPQKVRMKRRNRKNFSNKKALETIEPEPMKEIVFQRAKREAKNQLETIVPDRGISLHEKTPNGTLKGSKHG